MLIDNQNIILASTSQIRYKILINAGIQCSVMASHVDELKIKQNLHNNEQSLETISLELAHAKAKSIGQDNPENIVIGADQMLVCGGQSFDKPENREGCYKTLQRLSGKTHRLISSVCLLKNMSIIGKITEFADLTMRNLNDYEINTYLDYAGEAIFSSVGAYHYESAGIQLFEKINGDYFTILGLPLIPVLKVLRQSGDQKV